MIAEGRYREGPEGQLLPPDWQMVSDEELKRLGWQAPEGDAPTLPEDGG